MYSQIILLLFGLHTISAQLKNIPPPPAIPRLDVASLPSYLQKLLAHVNDVQSNLEEQRPQTISRAHTYGMSLRSGQGEVWNDITGNYTNDFASSEPTSPSNNDHPRNGNNYHQTAKADEIAAPQTSSGKTDAIENYKDGSNDNQRLPSITPPQTLPLDKPKNEDQRGHSNPDKIIPSEITIQSQNIPLPTQLEDQKFKKTPSAKTYGMNLAGGHGHVWNNTGGSPLDVNDATPSESANSESKDKHNPVAATNGNEFVSPATLQPIVYSTTPEATTEKPAIVNYKESNLPNYNQNLSTTITNNPATTVKSQNPVPAIVPTNKEDYEVVNEIKKASSPKTYGMNLSGGHGHVWNNIDESHFDINKATPSKSVQPELKDETTPAAVYGDKLTLTTTVKPIVYSITPEGTSEKPTIVDKKHTMPSELVQPEVKDKTTPAAINDDTFRLTSSVKPVVYAITPEAAAQRPAIFDNTDGTPFQSVQPELKDKTTPATDVDKFTLTTTVKAMYNTNPEAKSEEPAIVNYKESNHNQKNIPAATTNKPAIAVTSQNPVNTNTKDYEFENDFKKYGSPKTYGMSLSGGHGHVWNNIDESHFDINKDTPLKSVQPELKDKTTSAATNGDKFTWTTPVKPVVYTTPEATSENPVIVNNKDATPSESAQLESKDKATPAATSNHDLTSTTVVKPIVYTMSSEASSEKPPIINHKDNANNNNQNLPSATTTNPVTNVNSQKPVSPIAEDVKRASPRTYGMRLEGDHGYVWNDLIEPGMHYNLDNPTTANDENSSEVPVTKKPTENATSAKVDPTSKNDNETLPVTTAQPSTESYRITSTERSKNNDSSSNGSSELEPEDDLLKYIERLVQEEVAKSLKNATKTDNTNDKEIMQEDKMPLNENANNTLDNIPKNVKNLYGSLIGEGNVTNIFIFYPNDKNLESIVNDAKNIIKPQKNKSNETEADSNENRLTEAPSTLTTESSTTTNTERPNTESTTTPDVTTSSEKDNDTISVTTENSIDSTTSETKTDSSSESYETTTTGSPNTTTEANNKKDDETSELKEEIKKYIDKLVKDEVADQLDKERKNGIEKEKEPDIVPVTTEKSNNDTTDATSTESPTSEKITEAPDSTFPTTSNEKDLEITSETTEKSNNNTNDMITPEPSTTEEASTQSSENTTTDTPNINSTTEVNTKNEDGTPSEPKMPDSVDDLKKYVEKLVKDEVAKLLNAKKNNGSKNENEPDIIPVTTEKAKNDTTDTTSTESPATEKNTEAPDSTNVTTSSEQDGETTPVTTENTKNDTPDTTSTESPVSENDTGVPDSTNATTSEEDHASNPDPTENSNNYANDTMSTESPTTEIASTQSSEKTTTENPNITSTTEANAKNEDGSPSGPKMPVSADELKKYVEKLVKDEVAKLLDAEKNNGSKKENEPDAVPVTTEKSNNETTDTISTEFPATEKSTEASDSTNATTSSEQDDDTTPMTTEKTNNDTSDMTTTESPATEENTEAPDSTTTSSENSNDTTPMTTEKTNNDTSDMTTTESPATEENTEAPDSTTTSSENSNDTTPMTTEKTNNDTSDTMSTESPATEENTEAPDSTNATESSEKDNDTTPVTTEGTTESTSEENKEQASTESSNATSTSEPNKENDETTSSNMTPESKEEIKKYVEQLVKEEVAKLMAAGKNDASKNEDAKPANATDEDAAPVES